MRKHGSLSWKRTWFWSNSRLIQRLDLGPMTSVEKVSQLKTTKQWVDPVTGKKRFQGNKFLKDTQWLCQLLYICSVPRQYTWRFARHLIELVPEMRNEARANIPPAAAASVDKCVILCERCAEGT